MTFSFPGYDLEFIQKKTCKDPTDHLFTIVYKFRSPITKFHYILHADYHTGDVFAIKFYAKPHRHSDYKYSKIVNKGDMGNILITCAKVVPLLLQEYPNASFGFAASRTVDSRVRKVENLRKNQRFQTYSYIASIKFGVQTFAHFSYEEISAYLLVNRACGDVDQKERNIVAMLSATYINLVDIT